MHEKNPTIFQITSSPISHAAWLEEYFDDVLEAIPAPQPILGKALLEAIRLSGESIDRFTLDRPGPGNYRTQLHGMRANRNFGRVGIERVRVDRRAYQFHLSIHGQPDGLAWDIEIDLDNEFVIPTGVAPYPAVANIRDHRL